MGGGGREEGTSRERDKGRKENDRPTVWLFLVFSNSCVSVCELVYVWKCVRETGGGKEESESSQIRA